MILVGDVHIVTCPDIITNLYGEVPNNARTFSDQATIPNRHNSITQTLLTRNHSSGEGAIWTNHRVAPDVDEPLIENCVRWKADHTLFTKTAKQFSLFR